MPMPENLVALSMAERLVMNDRGEALRIVGLYDEFGEATDDAREAASFVAGPDRNGRWWAAAVSDFEQPVRH